MFYDDKMNIKNKIKKKIRWKNLDQKLQNYFSFGQTQKEEKISEIR